jgi:hypothetical protein
MLGILLKKNRNRRFLAHETTNEAAISHIIVSERSLLPYLRSLVSKVVIGYPSFLLHSYPHPCDEGHTSFWPHRSTCHHPEHGLMLVTAGKPSADLVHHPTQCHLTLVHTVPLASRASALPRLCACVSKELHIWHCVCTPYVRCMPLERHMQTAWGRVSLPGGAISITEASYGQRPWAKEKDDGTRRAYTE